MFVKWYPLLENNISIVNMSHIYLYLIYIYIYIYIYCHVLVSYFGILTRFLFLWKWTVDFVFDMFVWYVFRVSHFAVYFKKSYFCQYKLEYYLFMMCLLYLIIFLLCLTIVLLCLTIILLCLTLKKKCWNIYIFKFYHIRLKLYYIALALYKVFYVLPIYNK